MSSRVAKYPVVVPNGVTVEFIDNILTAKGKMGEIKNKMHPLVKVELVDNKISFKQVEESKASAALSGTMRALVNNQIRGVSEGFTKKLELRGVGYRCQIKENSLNLSLGYSHPIIFEIPEGIKIETPSQTELLVIGADKQQVGQVAAKIREFRPPEPYKGKGVRYSDETVVIKETKK